MYCFSGFFDLSVLNAKHAVTYVMWASKRSFHELMLKKEKLTPIHVNFFIFIMFDF